MSSNTKAQPTEGERELVEQFRAYLEEIFQHDDLNVGATLVDRVTRVSFDLVEASGILADSEFGGELAGYLCRRACDWRRMAIELTKFLDTTTAEERSELSTLKSAQYSKELRAQLGSGLLMPPAVLA